MHVVARRSSLVASLAVASLFDTRFHLPTQREVDGRLLVGAAMFGIGWGLGGFCRGPGIVAAASGAVPAIAFVAAMTVCILFEGLVLARRPPAGPSPEPHA